MVVLEITFPEEFDEVLRKNTKVAVDFTASWYGPCRYIRPVFRSLSENYKSLVFVSVDVDSLADLARKHDIRAMPTFKFFSNGELVDELTGADKAGLEAKTKAHAAEEINWLGGHGEKEPCQ